MATDDYLYRFIFEDLGIRGEFVRLNASRKALQTLHNYPELVDAELGRGLVAITLLSGTIKFKGSLTLQTQGDGAMRSMIVQATEQRTIRGLARYQGELPEGDLQAIYGNGRLTLTTEAPSGEKYQGIVELKGQHIGNALEGYFEQSEQLPTRLWLAANSDAASGLFLQRMPDSNTSEEDWVRVCMLADTIKDQELYELDVEEILHRLFHEENVRLFDPDPVSFRCSCSRERIEQALLSMGKEEVDSIIAEQGAVDADCEFCNAHYRFDAVDAAALFSDTLSTDQGSIQ